MAFNEPETLESIMNKYNRLCARYRDLQQTAQEKQDKWAELEKEFRINEALTRELCELILAKDPHEMVLGSEYSWGKLPVREIITRSKTVFADYNASRTQLLRDIQRQSEERRLMIESLKTQIEQDMHARQRLEALRQGSDAQPEEFDPVTGEVKPAAEKPDEKAKKRMAYNIQQAEEKGAVDVLPYDEEELSQSVSSPIAPEVTAEDIKRGEAAANTAAPKAAQSKSVMEIAASIGESAREAAAARSKEMAQKSVEVSLERKSIVMTPSQKKMKAIEQAKKEKEIKIMQVDISTIEEKLTERNWLLMEVIGSTGLCEGSDIVNKAIEIQKERKPDDKVTNSGLRYELMTLANSGCVTMDTNVAHPMKSRFAVYSLSPIGQNLYTRKFGKDPVASERDKLIADHDNLEHAFGIKCLKKILESSGAYSSVSMDRRANTVKLQDGTFYIPDIKATVRSRKGNFTAYIEYERGTHHQADFNIKLNKAVKVTRHVDIVCPNTAVVQQLESKVSAWIESRGGGKTLPGVRVRLTSLRKLDGQKEINRDDNWQVVFDLKHGDTPIERL